MVDLAKAWQQVICLLWKHQHTHILDILCPVQALRLYIDMIPGFCKIDAVLVYHERHKQRLLHWVVDTISEV